MLPYKYIEQDDESKGVIRLNIDGSTSWITNDIDHYLWREYLEWKVLGNTPEDAD